MTIRRIEANFRLSIIRTNEPILMKKLGSQTVVLSFRVVQLYLINKYKLKEFYRQYFQKIMSLKLIFLSILLLGTVLFFIARENMLNGLFFRHSFSSIFGDLSLPTIIDFKSSHFNGAKDSVNKESLHFYIIDNLFQKKQESITTTKNVPSILSVDSPYIKNRKGIVLDSI